MTYQVIITTSGLGSRLGNITNFTNKSLVRIGKKPALSYIIESYPKDYEFIITIGHFGDHVKQFLELAYPDRKIKFVTIDKYQGPGSSLAYSLLQTKQFISGPFIFHACDTVLLETIPSPISNWLGGVKMSNANAYRTFNSDSNIVYKINDKGIKDYDYVYIGVCGINNNELFLKELENIVEDNNSTSLSDCHVIEKMLKVEEFETVEFKKWLDIGNIDSLTKAREEIPDKFQILDKDDESIFIFNDYVVKFFHDEKLSRNRVSRALKLKGLVPEILDSRTNFYKYEYQQGDVLSHAINEINFKELIDWAGNVLWKDIDAENSENVFYDFYFEKTVKRIKKYFKDNSIEDSFDVINGFKIPPVLDMISKIPAEYLCENKSTQFHGDFILDNIVKTDRGFSLIDWRQDFGGQLEFGDMYYDLGKLNHSLVLNHDIINQNLFYISKEDGNIKCNILRSHILTECQNLLKDICLEKGYDLNKINLLSSIIWLNMAPLHNYPLNKFLFYFGKYMLFKNMEKIWGRSYL